MKITLIAVGSFKKGYAKEGYEDYAKRIKRYVPFESVEVKEEPATKKTPTERVAKKEGERILAKLREGDFVIALDERGRAFTSGGLSEQVERLMVGGKRGLVFIVGGAWGLDPGVMARADLVMKLSDMTLPHELARVVLAEQLYRALTIMRGEPYSH